MPLEPGTVEGLKDRIFKKFPRKDVRVQDMFDTDLEEWVRSLSAEYPFWFLRIVPDSVGFPAGANISGDWFARGWLRAVAGQAEYIFSHPLENDQSANASLWAQCQVSRVNYVREMDATSGLMRSDLPFVSPDLWTARQMYSANGRPVMFTWENKESYATLRLRPTPDQAYVYAVDFHLRYPPIYTAGGSDHYNRWLTYAPKALETYCLIELGDYFDEAGIAARMVEKLYGAAGRDAQKAVRFQTGELGSLVKETLRWNQQFGSVVRHPESTRESVGRLPSNWRMNSPYGWFRP